ncbi:hypothetical protein D5F01_LYC04325 [Larimichthys crocea]|uniref:Uncharacterized protein n=1 Tax=Larimichthys crocea TaxID=215358 RepID=A0A6G0J255_LARCR|nr:hypothetical protein D5F01_LYC04325 [Larimichthys crocea]
MESITLQWRSSLSLSDGSGVTNAAAVHAASHGHAGSECFSSSSSSTSSSTFLLHAASQPGELAGPMPQPCKRGNSRQARPRLFQQSQRPTEQQQQQRRSRSGVAAAAATVAVANRAQLSQTLQHPQHPCRTGTQRGIQDLGMLLLRSYAI